MTYSKHAYHSAHLRLNRILHNLDSLNQAMQHDLVNLTPEQLFRLDDDLQTVRRAAVASADKFRQYVIGIHLQQLETSTGKAILERPEQLRNEIMQVPAQFAYRQTMKTRVRNEAKVVEKLLHWAGGDPISVFNSGESGALRSNPWRVSLIEQACGRTYLLKEPDGEPKVVAISQYQADRKVDNDGRE